MERQTTSPRTLETPLVALLASLADATRCRMLVVLEEHELAVGELCTVLQLPQSTVSRHLKVLVEHGWLSARRDGTSHFYRLDLEAQAEAARGLWEASREAARELAEASGDAGRIDLVLAARRGASKAFFASGAVAWDALRDEWFGRSFEANALLALLDPGLAVADLASGSGRVAEVLAPHVGTVIAIDESLAMLEAARERTRALGNVEVRHGALEALPLGDRSVDAATLFLALHHLAEPEAALVEVRRVLRPGGRLLLVDMLPHDREELRTHFGHVWLGFDRDRIARLTAAAGLDLVAFSTLSTNSATGPNLFVAVAGSHQRSAVPDVRPSLSRSFPS
jgi:ArsR family transcriptional regulator